MEILFLGTSSGWPLPRLGCNCGICSSSSPKDKRLRPSLLVNKTLLLDAPPDIYNQLTNLRIDPTKITHIFLTHAHDDHVFGLYDLSHIYGKDEPIKLVSTVGVLGKVRQKLAVSLLSFKTVPVRPFEKYNVDANSAITFLPVEHTTETYGIKIKAPKPVFYAPEFRKIRPSSQKEVGDIDLAIIDGSSKGRQGQARGHESLEEGLTLRENIKAKRVLFTNIGHKTDTHENLTSFVKSAGGEKFGIAFDGLAIKL